MGLKILLINNFAEISEGGGPANFVLYLKRLLKENNHEARIFSASLGSQGSDYFLPPLDQNILGSKNIFKKACVALKAIYNPEAKQALKKIIEDFKPDIAHCHNIYNHITPSILPVLKSRGIPVVMTLHDLKLACPNHRMFTQGALCERCKKHRYYNALLHRCFRNSRQASLIGTLEAYSHRWMRYFEKYVDIFISPSFFLREKMIEWGWPSEKIIPLNIFVEPQTYSLPSPKRQFLYFGIFDALKGTDVLLNAVKQMRHSADFLMIGAGSSESEIKKRIVSEGLTRVHFRGFLDRPAINDILKESTASILPSVGYENQPATLLETMACGRPVVASRIGGIPEIVEDYETGLLFTPGDSRELAGKLDWMIENPEKVLEMGKKGYQKIHHSFTPEIHYKRLMDIYEGLL